MKIYALKDENRKGTIFRVLAGFLLNFPLYMLVKQIEKPFPIVSNKREQ